MEVSASSAIRRRQLRRYAVYGAAAVLAGAVAYKACRSDAVAQTRQSLARLRAALIKYSEALSSGADLCCTLVRDLQSFLQSDTGEVPPSLRQLARLLQSPEVTQTTAKTVSAVYCGLAGSGSNGSASPATDGGDGSGQGAVDKVLAALLSDRGHSLVSVAVSLGARNLVGGLVEGMARVQDQQRVGGPPPPGVVDKILDFCATQRGQQLAVAAITAFVTNGVRVYMDSTLDINFYEDIFSSMARPAHLEAVKQCVGMFAREAVGTAMQGGSPQRPEQQRGSRAALIRELSPSPSASHISTPVHAQQQQQQECSEFRAGSPSDSAFRSSLPGACSPPASVSAGAPNGDAASAPLPTRLERRQLSGELSDGGADDLDSDSLLHAQRAQGAKQGQQQQGGSGLAWLPAVTKEVLAVVKDPNARSVLVGAAAATAHEFGTAMVAGLGQLEVTRRWGTRGLVALLLLTFLSVCLMQELLRAAVLTVLR